MTPERWAQVKQLLEGAMTLEGDARASYLSGACSDPDLRQEVETLLASHERAGNFLATPVVNLRSADSARNGGATRAGRRIGVYDVLEQIGHGGMGDVYRAVRADGHFTKQVALKLVRSGVDAAFIVERFRHERQILAGLDHPNIARLIDGGTTEDGVPYLVMELVEGQAIDEYCDRHHLTITGRLQLFRRICSAVHYAHQRLVVHRDIKPSNVLVTKEGEPKLLDFGIAKILDPSAVTDVTMARPMTVEYASPEQIRGEPITTSTDVYSLGVVLYRLLTARSPYGAGPFRDHELARAICEQEPERPSAAVVTHPAASPGSNDASSEPQQVARVREGSIAKLQRRLAGDVDDVTLMALRKEPRMRYASVEQLEHDVRRHLDGLPVVATKGSWRYRAGKFVRRHKAAMAAAALVLVAVVGGVGTTAREARIARAERARAEKRFNDVRKLANSLIFEIHDSIEKVPGATPARKLIVQRSIEYLDSLSQEAKGDASLQRELAAAYQRVGRVQGHVLFANLGDSKGSVQSYEKSLLIRQDLAKLNPRERGDQLALAGIYRELGLVEALAMGNVAQALPHLRKAIETTRAVYPSASNDPATIEELANDYQSIGSVLGGNGTGAAAGDMKGALENYRQSLALFERLVTLEPQSPGRKHSVAINSVNLGDMLSNVGDRADALAAYRRAKELWSVLPSTYKNSDVQRDLAIAFSRTGDVLLIDGAADQAIASYQEGLRIIRPLAAADPKNVDINVAEIGGRANIGRSLVAAARLDEGREYLAKAKSDIDAISRSAGDAQTRTVVAIIAVWLGEALEAAGDPRGALVQYQQAWDIYSSLARADGSDVADDSNAAQVAIRIGGVYAHTRKLADARKEFEEAVRRGERLAPANPSYQELQYVLAAAYAGLGDVSADEARGGAARGNGDQHWTAAGDLYAKSVSIWRQLPNPGRVSPNMFTARSPQDVARRLAECQSHPASGTR